MIKDVSDFAQQSLLWLFNGTLASHFPERRFVGLIAVVFKSGDKFDMGNYRGISVGSVVAKLFAKIPEERTASWAEENAVQAKRQAGFRKGFCTTDNVFILEVTETVQTERDSWQAVLLLWRLPKSVRYCDVAGAGGTVHGRILDIIKSLYAYHSAAARSS